MRFLIGQGNPHVLAFCVWILDARQKLYKHKPASGDSMETSDVMYVCVSVQVSVFPPKKTKHKQLKATNYSPRLRNVS